MNVSTLHGLPAEGRLTDKLIVITWHDSGLNGGVSHCPTGGVLVLCTGSLAKLLSGPHIQTRFRNCSPIYALLTTPYSKQYWDLQGSWFSIILHRCINGVSTEIRYYYCVCDKSGRTWQVVEPRIVHIADTNVTTAPNKSVFFWKHDAKWVN